VDRRGKWLIAPTGAFIVVYAVVVLGYVATSPDLRLRCLLVDEPADWSAQHGVEIRATPGLKWMGDRPYPGDLLLGIREDRTRTFIDFAEQLSRLRNQPIPPGGSLHPNADPTEGDESLLPPLVEVGDGDRVVRIEFLRKGTRQAMPSWLHVQSLPLHDVLISLLWFLLQLGVFAVGALAYWKRPFDRSSQLFFTMCIVTLGSFVGGYHWWVVAGSFWLTVPYVICSILVPVVSLHFFLVFPRPKRAIAQYPRLSLVGLYVVPAVSMAAILGWLAYTRWLSANISDEVTDVDRVTWGLEHLRFWIYSYFGIAAAFFAATLAAVRHSYTGARTPMERSQLRWIWGAGKVAALFVAVTLLLVYYRRTEFALGMGRILIFLASLSFMLAYAVGIIRYRLMLVDQIISKGMLYYAASIGLTFAFSVTVALSTLLPQFLNISLSPQQALSVAVVLTLAVVLLLWLRDLFQRNIDRQFFREKYQLDKALRRMNRAISHFVDPEALAEVMLTTCRDVLGVEKAALYLRKSPDGPFQLVGAIGPIEILMQISSNDDFIDALKDGGSLQRVTPGTRSEMSPVQNFLREQNADLVHPLEIEQGVTALIVLGAKKNSAPFTAEDVTFLNALGQITNVALHSAKVDQNMADLNQELQLKADKIAEQQRQLAMMQVELGSEQGENDADSQPETTPKFQRDVIIGNSPAIKSVLKTVQKVAASDSSVLIRGESGTGKELLAHLLHENNPRRAGARVSVHCASLSAGLLESELFGHVKGAFTGAQRDRHGRFKMADGGTLFLDEVGDIAMETQIKLLRVLQERCFQPVGSTKTIHVDVRLIAATHQDLEELIVQGRFREDLYYRLKVISISLPPLRERKEDIFELAVYFLKREAQRAGKRFTNIDNDALAALERYSWPGNIRELENVIERVVVFAEHETISLNDLPDEIVQPTSLQLPDRVAANKRLALTPVPVRAAARRVQLDQENEIDSPHEREVLLDALRRCGGNKSQAARLLGMPRSTYFSKLKKHTNV